MVVVRLVGWLADWLVVSISDTAVLVCCFLAFPNFRISFPEFSYISKTDHTRWSQCMPHDDVLWYLTCE